MEGAENNHMAVQVVHTHCTCRRMYVRTRAICLVTFIAILCCCAYCTWTMIQVKTMLAACDRRSMDASSTVHHQSPHMDNARQPNQERFPDDKSLQQSYPDDQYDSDLKWRVKRKAKSKSKGKKRTKLLAGHYQSFANEAYINKHITGYTDVKLTSECKAIAELKGTLCRSQDFTTNNHGGTLNVFKQAAWVKKKTAPFLLKDNGIFQAKSKGVYLVYAQVLFHDNKPAQIIQLVQHRSGSTIQTLSCFLHVDENEPEAVYNTCGITGLFYLHKKDTLQLQNVYNDVKLNLRNSTTYLGAVLLK